MDDIQRVNDEFFKLLRITVNHATTYFKGHPVFAKAVDELRVKIDAMLAVSNPLVIGVAPGYLTLCGAKCEATKHVVELAQILHRRRIKGVTISLGVSNDEVGQFLTMIALSAQDIAKRSKEGPLLSIGPDAHIRVDGLDYFELLREGGDGEKDVWAYLLMQAAEKTGGDEFKEFSGNFSKITDKFRGKDFLEKPQLKEAVSRFLTSVKSDNPDNFGRCAHDLARVILRDKNLAHHEKVEQFQIFFKDVDVVDLSNTLWDEIVNNEHFDFLTFKLFSQLVDKERHNDIAVAMAAAPPKDDILRSNVQVARRMKELFASPNDAISIVYRKALDGFLGELEHGTANQLVFDRAQAYVNYRYILLNLLMLEGRESGLKPALDNIVSQWDRIVESDDIVYIRNLLEVLDKKKRLEPTLAKVFESDERKIYDFIENKLLEEEDIAYFDLYYAIADKSVANSDLYLTKIFRGGKMSPNILKLFFKFFENKMPEFYEEVRSRRRDDLFLKNLISSLKQVDSPFALRVIELIFDMPNDAIRIEAVRALGALGKFALRNESFLLSALTKVGMYLRREIVLVLISDLSLRTAAVEALLNINNPFGSNNQTLGENITIVQDLKIIESLPALRRIAGDWSLFKLDIAARAKSAIEKIEGKKIRSWS